MSPQGEAAIINNDLYNDWGTGDCLNWKWKRRMTLVNPVEEAIQFLTNEHMSDVF